MNAAAKARKISS